MRAISEQYERVRESAEEESQRSSEALRAIYAQTAGDTQSHFREANERFAETVQSMKQMAAEMHRELESTRSELRRGVFELPQEAAESASQMRQVIVDQIEALAELNRIVARHGRNLDAVEPCAGHVRSTLAIVGSRNDVTARSDAPPRNEAPARDEGPPRGETPSRSEAPSRPAQRPDQAVFRCAGTRIRPPSPLLQRRPAEAG